MGLITLGSWWVMYRERTEEEMAVEPEEMTDVEIIAAVQQIYIELCTVDRFGSKPGDEI